MGRARAVMAAALVAAVAMVGCGDDDDSGGGGESSASDVATPVVVDVDALDGTTVEATEGQVVDVNVGDSDVTAWTATVEDDSIVRFEAGRDDGSATFNPGFEARAAGSTAVTMTDGTTTVVFTIQVRES